MFFFLLDLFLIGNTINEENTQLSSPPDGDLRLKLEPGASLIFSHLFVGLLPTFSGNFIAGCNFLRYLGKRQTDKHGKNSHLGGVNDEQN